MLLPLILTALLLPLKTSAYLTSIQAEMEERGFQAYIVPMDGAHYGGNTADCDRRIQAISGFTGGAGTAIVMGGKGYLWSDGRYFDQAESELTDPENWQVMRDDRPGFLSQADWLKAHLVEGNVVGVDGQFYFKFAFDRMSQDLSEKRIVLKSDNETNLIDSVMEVPLVCGANHIMAYSIGRAGKTVTDKLIEVRAKMVEEGVALLLVSELDEIAWLFNLRGDDIYTVPVFYSYAFVYADSTKKATLLVKNVEIYGSMERSEVDVRKDANNGTGGGYSSAASLFATAVEELGPDEKVWVSKYVNNYMMTDLNTTAIPNKVIVKLSPIALLKAIKNDDEVKGMAYAHLKDSAAIVAFLSWMQRKIVDEGDTSLNEWSAAEQILAIRNRSKETGSFKGPSFRTISAYGPNAGKPHYRPTESNHLAIGKDNVYLVDSGGQYEDGTTDITRTVHFGTPLELQRDRFTRVVKGHIAVATARFPPKTTGHRLDTLARKFLWDVGVDYQTGTGHGIGHYLFIHEGPHGMGSGPREDDTGLEANMYLSNEPGYYDATSFGIRLENIVRVVPATDDGEFLTFETISFIPIQLNMLEGVLLTSDEIAWLNDYHLKCRQKVGDYIRDANYFDDKDAVLAWLEASTVTWEEFNSSGVKVLLSTFTLTAALLVQCFVTKFIL